MCACACLCACILECISVGAKAPLFKRAPVGRLPLPAHEEADGEPSGHAGWMEEKRKRERRGREEKREEMERKQQRKKDN